MNCFLGMGDSAMLRNLLSAALISLLFPSLSFAADPKAELQAAVKKLAAAPNYSWTTKVEGGFSRGAGDGKTEKDGATSLEIKLMDDSYQVIIKGDKAAAKGMGGWASTAELARDAEEEMNNFSPERFLLMSIKAFKTPAELAQDLCDKVQSVQKSGDAYTADLDEETVKRLLTFLRRRGTDPNAQVDAKDPKGSAKCWVTNGTLTKMEVHLQGTVTFNNTERKIDRTTTTEIKDIGSTKVDVPEEAKAKL
jgi:hypothetical protein